VERVTLDRVERAWEDFEESSAITTNRITVTETHIVMWSMTAGDWLPIHVDKEYCKETAFGERIAHGPLTLSLALGLVTQSGVFGNSIIAWLGLDELRATAPVMIGDTIHVVATVIEQARTSKPGRGRVQVGYAVINQRDEQVMSFKSSFLMRCRGDNGAATTLR
jgi:itaconyl-CoA hydratase